MERLILFMILALVVSFVCSILEAVLLSVTPAFVSASCNRPGWGRRLVRLKQHVDRPLAAILGLNTIANTIGAAGVGAEAARIFGSAAVGWMSAILTLLILVFSEIIPKTLGALYWRQLAPLAAWVLPVMTKVLGPLVWLALQITRRISRGNAGAEVSREEVIALTGLGVRSGVFQVRESEILQHLLRAGRLRTSDAMTPRTVVFALPENQTVGDVLAAHPAIPFSRIPLYGTNLDDITGYVRKEELLLASMKGEQGKPISVLKRPMLTVPDFLPLLALFEQLVDRQEQIALVVDEYGGVEGIVTLEDVVETMLGMEIIDEADPVPDMQAYARSLKKRRDRGDGAGPCRSGEDE